MAQVTLKIDFPTIAGQPQAKKHLQYALAHERLAHAYLFSGPEGTGKIAMALDFARVLLCRDANARPCGTCTDCRHVGSLVHPNLQFLFAHPKSAKEEDILAVKNGVAAQPYLMDHPWPNAQLSIDSVRALRRDLSLRIPKGQNRVIILVDAHTMTAEAANALLKMLEEPPENTYFILTTDNEEALLPTIRSRCQQLRFGKLPIADIEVGLRKQGQYSEEQIRTAARLAGGSMRRALELLETDLTALRNEAVQFLRSIFKTPGKGALYVQELVQKYDKAVIRQMLENLLYWLRDAAVLQSLGNEEAAPYLTNSDDLGTLQKFVGSLGTGDITAAIREVEISIGMLDRYVQPGLVLTVLLNTLRRHLRAPSLQQAA